MAIKPKKSLGQHFLRSKSALEKIIEASDITPDEIVLEIGPGEGVLTEKLLKVSGKVVAIEKDRGLIPNLKIRFKKEIEEGKLDLIEQDILDFDLSVLNFYEKPYSVVANIPYYITGQILRKFLEADKKPISMTLLVQKEVADRIVAKNSKESLLSISVKAFGEPKYIATVKKGSFSPPPKVDSAIISVKGISRGRFVSENITGVQSIEKNEQLEKRFFEVVKAGFAHKRKFLINNLGSGLKISKSEIETVFKKNNLSPKIRPEDLSIDDWFKLTKNLEFSV